MTVFVHTWCEGNFGGLPARFRSLARKIGMGCRRNALRGDGCLVRSHPLFRNSPMYNLLNARVDSISIPPVRNSCPTLVTPGRKVEYTYNFAVAPSAITIALYWFCHGSPSTRRSPTHVGRN